MPLILIKREQLQKWVDKLVTIGASYTRDTPYQMSKNIKVVATEMHNAGAPLEEITECVNLGAIFEKVVEESDYFPEAS